MSNGVVISLYYFEFCSLISQINLSGFKIPNKQRKLYLLLDKSNSENKLMHDVKIVGSFFYFSPPWWKSADWRENTRENRCERKREKLVLLRKSRSILMNYWPSVVGTLFYSIFKEFIMFYVVFQKCSNSSNLIITRLRIKLRQMWNNRLSQLLWRRNENPSRHQIDRRAAWIACITARLSHNHLTRRIVPCVYAF